tara:strand:- start:6488 stop:7357 length:870 start_codon:yes stop_codon:yes gene_type:complete
MAFPFIKNSANIFWNEWINLNPIFYNNFLQSNIFYSGNISFSDKVDIVTMNHFNRLDFMITNSLIKKYTDKNVYLIIQKGIGKIPIISCCTLNNIMVDRNIESDKDNIANFIKKINDGIIVILPEGTRMNKQNFKKSEEFSKTNNLKVYNNLLYPKMKGLDVIINSLNNQNKLGNLIDITIKVDGLKKFETGFLSYLKNIKNTYCYINTYKVNNNVFNNYELFKKWYLMIWDKKEHYLDNYYDYKYKKFNYNLKTSTFIINIIFVSLLIFQSNILNGGLLSNKNNIIIK